MSIFGSIMGKIFGHPAAKAQEAPAATDAGAAAAVPGGATPGASVAGTSVPAPGAPPAVPGGAAAGASYGTPAGAAGTPAANATPQQPVDVNAVLTQMASANGQTLNWKQSIVDLMKLLGLDSSLEARKELAQELHYTGDSNDSASMNIWLHKQVMTKLAENGGKVPAELRN
jgi:hypothetical protein